MVTTYKLDVGDEGEEFSLDRVKSKKQLIFVSYYSVSTSQQAKQRRLRNVP